MKQDDAIFREIAALYIEQEAAALRDEMQNLPEQDTAALDRRVRREITRLKLRPVIRPLALVAACLALVMLLPRALERQNASGGGAVPQDAAPQAAEIAIASEEAEIEEFAFDAALPEDAPMVGFSAPVPDNPTTAGPGGDAPMDTYDGASIGARSSDVTGGDGSVSNAETEQPMAITGELDPATGGGEVPPEPDLPSVETGGIDPATGGGGEPPEPAAANVETGGFDPETGGGGSAYGSETISGSGMAAVPMTFALPQDYESVGYEEDNGKSIYHLRHQSQVAVVMVLEVVEEAPALPLKVMQLGDREVYYQYTGDYSQIVFEQNGVLYDLTCEGDIAYLISLGEEIVEAL